MPKTIKKKTARHKPVQESTVKSPVLHKIEKLKERQKQIITAAVVVAAAVALYSIYTVYSSSLTEKARILNNEAAGYYYGQQNDESIPEDERMKKAVELYTQSIDVKPTPEALFYLGNSYYKLGDYENAVKQYNKFAERFKENEKILPLVYQKLASACFKSGRKEKALEALGKLSRISDGVFKDTALVIEARHLESTGQKEKAFRKYRQILEEFPSSAWAAEAGSKVSVAEEVRTEDSAKETDKKTGTEKNNEKEPLSGEQAETTESE